jgi:hypothetical protein
VSIGTYFVSEGQIIVIPSIATCHVVTARNVSLVVSVEPDNGQCGALLPVEEKDRLYIR